MGVDKLVLKVPRKRANKARVRKGVFIIPVLLVLLCFLIIPLFTKEYEEVKKLDVKVSLLGDASLAIPLNNVYNDLGFQLYDGDKKISNEKLEYKITNNIDIGILGDYEVNYEIYYKDEIYRLKRQISVIDSTKPEIVVDNPIVEIFECKKSQNNNLSYTATDNYDGVITDDVEVKEMDEEFILSVSDSSGNKTEVSVPKKFVEDSSKVIKLNGKTLVYIPKGNSYKDEGANLYNGCGKKINEKLKVVNNVDTSKVGTYYVLYNAMDGDNVVSTKTRTVIVYDKKLTNKNDNNKEDKVIYLTFDDGPGRYTKDLLHTLKKYNVKATFFVTNQFKDYVPLISAIHNEGHVVAVHTLTHKWSIYSSVETYMKDFNDMNSIIESYTGKRSKIFRFPGGSSNTVSKGYSKGVVSAIASKMNGLGYVYFDWNVDSGDASGASRDSIVKNTIDGIEKKDYPVVLMHDIKKNTLDAIEDIIVYCIDKGYKFEVLTVDSPTVQHGIRN